MVQSRVERDDIREIVREELENFFSDRWLPGRETGENTLNESDDADDSNDDSDLSTRQLWAKWYVFVVISGVTFGLLMRAFGGDVAGLLGALFVYSFSIAQREMFIVTS